MHVDTDKDLRALLGDDLDDHEQGEETSDSGELNPGRDLRPRIDSGYTEDWVDISRRTRESIDWVCEECGKSFVDNKTKLHVHHRDGDKQNNLPDNLQVLCVKCHEITHGFRFG